MQVGAFWGCTNPFLKQGSKGVDRVKATSALGQLGAELWFLFSNWRYTLPFAINQCGSLMYYITLGGSGDSTASKQNIYSKAVGPR